MKRREFLKTSAILSTGAGLLSSGCMINRISKRHKKVIVLGIDGMDTHLSQRYLQQGALPHFKKLTDMGSYSPVASSFPPQSPVAWSNFIVGAPSSVHGIFDFIHRDPETMIPYLSSSKVSAPEKTLDWKEWKIPFSKGSVENLRRGKPFWEYLSEYDYPTTIFKMPANFPCESKLVNMVSGMGTPDLRGAYGSYTLISTEPNRFTKNLKSGVLIPIQFSDQVATADIRGPENTLKKNTPPITFPLKIWRDSDNPIIRIKIQNNSFILKQGEWTDWIQVTFPILGSIYTIKGICKLYVKSVFPEFNLYISPINIDPLNPVFPIAAPEKYRNELVRNVGYFYTQGFPEDTKALSEGVFTEQEYLDLAYKIIDERKKLLNYELTRFSKEKEGMLFFYISSLDQESHMYWRTIDAKHPLYTDSLAREYGQTLKNIYREMDSILGTIMDQYDIHDPDLSLMAMSDHGFAPFRKQVNLNTWLYKKGFLSLSTSKSIENRGYFENVLWSKTSAYNLGINSIYINIKGRERFGRLSESESFSLKKSICQELLSTVDPESGEKLVSKVWIVPGDIKKRNPHAPDIIVGWNYGYRTSWESILGGFSEKIITPNTDKWSGDHCVDSDKVPAVLYTNKKITKKNPNLCDITATILKEFSITPGKEVTGTQLYSI